ncbi:hypothetical protein Golax_025377 [Gossypium laxum]|uniref:Uncharacterized protein n=1 Tax=Gossypium laxum TaxID=34288 RepID=A0A7J9B1X3_9ROSI|nr:hypothetical protein [Gossypium laxum]
MRPSEYGPRQHNKRRVTVLQRGTCHSYGILLLSSSIGTLLIVVLLLERWIWYPLWKSTWLYSLESNRKVIVSAFFGEI